MDKIEKENEALILVSKDRFIEHVKRWVLLDTHIKTINEKTKVLRDERSNLTESICRYLDESNMKNKKISIPDGEIYIYEKKDYSPLTFTFLEEALGKIIYSKDHVDHILGHIKKQREIKTSMELRRTYK